MLLTRDPNSQSAPNFLNKTQKRNSDSIHDKDSRKSILKKNGLPKINIKEQEEFYEFNQQRENKQNSPLKVSLVVDNNSQVSSQFMRRINNKKKSVFLQLQSLITSNDGNEGNKVRSKERSNSQMGNESIKLRSNSQVENERGKSKKISFESHCSNSSSVVDFEYHSNYKQSKIDIVFSNSNISDEIWGQDAINEDDEEMDFELPEKSFRKSSEVEEVEIKVKQPRQRNVCNLLGKYNIHREDRIIQDDLTSQSRASKILTQKRTACTNNVSPCNTNSTNFRQASYYDDFDQEQQQGDGQCFMIIQSPPVEQIKPQSSINSTTIKLQEISNKLKGSRSEITVRSSKRQLDSSNVSSNTSSKDSTDYKVNIGRNNLNKGSSYQQRIQQSRRRLQQALQQSIYKHPEELGFTMNFTQSNTITKSTVRFNSQQEFKEQMFEKINLYRFLNRLEYKVRKYLTFQNNEDIMEQLITEIIRKKCFILLNTEIELESLTISQKQYSRADQVMFLDIVHAYIQKETLQPYWKEVKTQFQKVSFLYFPFNDSILQFLNYTIPQIQFRLYGLSAQLTQKNRNKETMLFQLRLKLMKYLYYDLYKLNMTESHQFRNIRQTPFNKQRRLKQIVQKNQWDQKIPFNQLLQQFQFLKQDLAHHLGE